MLAPVPRPLHEHPWAPALLAATVGAFGLAGGFVYDDYQAITHSPVVSGELAWSEIAARDVWGHPLEGEVASYRPVVVAFWRLLFALGPLAFRIGSLLLHVANTELLRRLSSHWLSPRAAFWAAALFAVHPVHAEAIGANVGQADLLGMFLGLTALTVGTQTLRRGLVAALLLGLSGLCKETFVVFSVALLLIEFQGQAKDEGPGAALWARLAPSLAVTAGLVLLHFSLDRAGALDPTNNLGVAAQGGMALMWAAWTLGRGAVMCIAPFGLAPNHGYASVSLEFAELWTFAALGLVVAALLVAASVHSLVHRRLDRLALLFVFAAPLTLQTNLFFDTLSDLAERLLYLPSAAICLAAGAWLASERASARMPVLATLVILLSIPLAGAPIYAWRDSLSLWTRAAEMEPGSVRSQANLGAALLNAGRDDEGAYHMLVSEAILSNYPAPFASTLLDELAALPVTERLDRAPASLSANPCALTDRTLQLLARTRPDVAQRLAPRWFGLHCRSGG